MLGLDECALNVGKEAENLWTWPLCFPAPMRPQVRMCKTLLMVPSEQARVNAFGASRFPAIVTLCAAPPDQPCFAVLLLNAVDARQMDPSEPLPNLAIFVT